MGDREERNAVEIDLLDPGIRIEDQVADEMTTFVKPKPHGATGKKLTGRLEAIHWGSAAAVSCAGAAEATAQKRATKLINRSGSRGVPRRNG